MRPELAAVAAAQGGPFLRGQALTAGYSSSAILRRVRSGSWIRLRPRVYVDAALVTATTEHRLRVAAALLVLASPAVVSHSSAGVLLGLELPLQPAVVELTVPPGRGPRGVPGAVLRQAGLPPGHRWVVDGVPVTSPARTVVDLARRLPFPDGVVCADSALQRTDLHVDDLRRVLVECWTWCGIRNAVRVVRCADPGSESPHESLCRLLFADLGLPAPRTQVAVGDADGFIGRVDFLWPEHATIAEADGRVKYIDPAALWQEKLREDRLRDAGFEVVRVTPWQREWQPDAVGRRIRAAFARHAAADVRRPSVGD